MTNNDTPPPTGEPTILASEWPRRYAQVGDAERKVLRMVWNTFAITGWIALACALTQLAG